MNRQLDGARLQHTELTAVVADLKNKVMMRESEIATLKSKGLIEENEYKRVVAQNSCLTEALEESKQEVFALTSSQKKEEGVSEYLKRKYDDAVLAMETLKKDHEKRVHETVNDHAAAIAREKTVHTSKQELLEMKVSKFRTLYKKSAVSRLCNVIPRYIKDITKSKFEIWKAHTRMHKMFITANNREEEARFAFKKFADSLNVQLAELVNTIAVEVDQKLKIQEEVRIIEENLVRISEEYLSLCERSNRLVSSLVEERDALLTQVHTISERVEIVNQSNETADLELSVLRRSLAEKEEKIVGLNQLLVRSQDILSITKSQLEDYEEKTKMGADESHSMQAVLKRVAVLDHQLSASKSVGSKLMKQLNDANAEILRLKRQHKNVVSHVLDAASDLQHDLEKTKSAAAVESFVRFASKVDNGNGRGVEIPNEPNVSELNLAAPTSVKIETFALNGREQDSMGASAFETNVEVFEQNAAEEEAFLESHVESE